MARTSCRSPRRQEAARKWFSQLARLDRGEVRSGPYTVSDCVEEYLAWLQAHRKTGYDARHGAQQTAPGGRLVRTIGIVRARIKIGLQYSRLECSPAGDVRTQEVSRFVQLGEPTGRRLMAESARRRSEAAPLHKSAQRRPLIFDEIRHQFELSGRSPRET